MRPLQKNQTFTAQSDQRDDKLDLNSTYGQHELLSKLRNGNAEEAKVVEDFHMFLTKPELTHEQITE